ncbi:hypothetical protein GCM10010430_49870 [Kitasatospora cystarginea]|uniref:Uncharacterized protein n=1 Tax=Kitasatospora cystarginea TaxID=58350 RepID=A0ABN3EJJ8_9ACTN
MVTRKGRYFPLGSSKAAAMLTDRKAPQRSPDRLRSPVGIRTPSTWEASSPAPAQGWHRPVTPARPDTARAGPRGLRGSRHQTAGLRVSRVTGGVRRGWV